MHTSRGGVSTPDQSMDPSAPVTIAVFCGSSGGTSPVHKEAAIALAHVFHSCNIKMVYGGGTGGIMGIVSNTLVSLSGTNAVHGVIPLPLMEFEQRFQEGRDGDAAGRSLENGDYGVITKVQTMHERKAMMAKEVMEGGPGSGFVALSGGWGTLEEIMEMATWNQLGIHDKGLALYNVDGYYNGLIRWVEEAVSAGFVSPANKEILAIASEPQEVVRKLRDYKLSPGRMSLNWAHK